MKVIRFIIELPIAIILITLGIVARLIIEIGNVITKIGTAFARGIINTNKKWNKIADKIYESDRKN